MRETYSERGKAKGGEIEKGEKESERDRKR